MSASSSEVLNSPVETAPAASPAKTATDTVADGIRNSLFHAREQLTDTVEALGRKVQVPSKVRDKWHATKDAAKATIGQATQQLHDGNTAVQNKAIEVTGQLKSLTGRAADQVPAPVTARAHQLTQTVRRGPVSAAAMVLTIFALLILRRSFPRGTPAADRERC